MTKGQVLSYLNDQLAKLQDPSINFDVWKSSVLLYMQKSLGGNHILSNRVKNLEPEITMSYEELYPSKVINREATITKFQEVINDIITEINSFDEAAFGEGQVGDQFDPEIPKTVIEALKNNLTGSQIKAFKEIINNTKEEELQKEIKEHVKTLDIEESNQILAEIFSCKALWGSL